MKKYFIALDFYNKEVNKFVYSIVYGWSQIDIVPVPKTCTGKLIDIFANGAVYLDCFQSRSSGDWITEWKGNIEFVKNEDVTHWKYQVPPPNIQ